jgi:acyl-CoA synthetase (AMP-forming)/AMP-acid ligase II
LKRAGRSIDCAYVENALRELDGVRAGRVAAFGVPGPGAEHLVVVVETALHDNEARAELVQHVGRAAREALGFSPDAVLLAAPGTIPCTTSGKVRHDALPSLVLSDPMQSARLSPGVHGDTRKRLLKGAGP